MPLSAKERTDFETKCKEIEAGIKHNFTVSFSMALPRPSVIRDLLKDILDTIGTAIKADETDLLDKIMVLTKTISGYPEGLLRDENQIYFNALKTLNELYTDAKREDPINLDTFFAFFKAVPLMIVPIAHDGGGAYKAMRTAAAGGAGAAAAPAATHPAAAGGGSGSGGGARAAGSAASIESELKEANALLAELESNPSYEPKTAMDLLWSLNKLASMDLEPSNIEKVLNLTGGLAAKLKESAIYDEDIAMDLFRLLNKLALMPLEPSNIEKVLNLTGGLAAYLRSRGFPAVNLAAKAVETHNKLLKKLPTELQSAHSLEKYYAPASGTTDESSSEPPAMRR